MQLICAAPKSCAVTFHLYSGYYDEQRRKLGIALGDWGNNLLFSNFHYSDDYYFGRYANQKEETTRVTLLSERKNPKAYCACGVYRLYSINSYLYDLCH